MLDKKKNGKGKEKIIGTSIIIVIRREN